MGMRLFLTSAGLRNDLLAEGLASLLGKPLTEVRVLVITTPANTGVDDKRWLIQNLNDFDRYGCASIDLLDVAGLPSELVRMHVEHADVICVGGGDERYLSRIIRDQDLKDLLTPLLKERVYMGISAGSMVAGRMLTSEASHVLYPEEDFDGETGESFGFVAMTFVPHLNSDFFLHARVETLESLREDLPTPLYALDDETALSIDAGNHRIVGRGESWILM